MKVIRYVIIIISALCTSDYTLKAEKYEDNPLLIVYSPFGSILSDKRSLNSQLNHATIGIENKNPIEALVSSQVSSPYTVKSKGFGDGAGHFLFVMNNEFILNHMYFQQNYYSKTSTSLPLLKGTSRDKLEVNWNQLLWTPTVSNLPFKPMLGVTIESSEIDFNGKNQSSAAFTPSGGEIVFYPNTSIKSSSKNGSLLAGLKYDLDSLNGFVLPYLGIQGKEETTQIKYGSGSLIRPDSLIYRDVNTGQMESYLNALYFPNNSNLLLPFSFKSVESKKSALIGIKSMLQLSWNMQVFASLERNLNYKNWNVILTFNYLLASNFGITLNLEVNQPNEFEKYYRGALGPSFYIVF